MVCNLIHFSCEFYIFIAPEIALARKALRCFLDSERELYQNKPMVLIYAVRAVHLLLIGFVTLAWLSHSQTVRWIHLFFVPILILHWRTNDNTCVLTEIEERWMRKQGLMEPQQSEEEAKKAAAQGGFVRRAFKFLSNGRELSVKTVNTLIYAVILVAWALTLRNLFIARTPIS